MDPREDARAIVDAGIAAVEPGLCVREQLNSVPGGISVGGEQIPVQNLVVVGGGKAALPMALAVPAQLGRVSGWLHEPADARLDLLITQGSGHPLPTVRADRTVDLVSKAEELVLVLLSGGASAMLCAPTIGLGAMRDVTQSVLTRGVPIEPINCVRRAGHLRDDELIASVGSDRVDGASHAAGAMADAATAGDPLPYLRRHDSIAFFERHGGLVLTGPTGTNVADLQVVLHQDRGSGVARGVC